MGQESDSERDDGLSAIVATVVTGLTLTLAFSLLALGWSRFWIVFVIGFAAVLPIAVTVASWYENRSSEPNTPETDDRALDTLREQYARGEISESEFEHRLERLLETEAGPNRDRTSFSRSPTPSEPGRERNGEREPETN